MKKITIYTTPTCPYCKAEKAYLTQKGLKYTEVDASQPENAKKAQDVSGQLGVPVTVIIDDAGKEEVFVGFDKPALDKALGL